MSRQCEEEVVWEKQLCKKEEKADRVQHEHVANVHRYFNSDHSLVHLPISLCYGGDSSTPLVTAVRR